MICVEEENSTEEDAIVTFHREDVPDLINHIRATEQEFLDYVPEPSNTSPEQTG